MPTTIAARVDSVARIPESHLCLKPPAPRSVKIELTGRCNWRCAFCALPTRPEQPAKDMDFSFFQDITNQMSIAGVKEIGVFYLGESFINPDLLVRCIEWLKQKVQMPYVFLTTNGSLAHPWNVERCMKAGLDSLKWSCNFADIDQFGRVTRSPSFWLTKARNNLRDAWRIRNDRGYSTRLGASSIRFDDDHFEKMQPVLAEFVLPYVDEHYWLPLYSMGDAATQGEAALGMKPTPGNRGRYDAPVDPLPCWSCFTVAHVLCDGRMSACCFDARGSWIMGDLRRQTFMEAWNSPAFQDLRKCHLAKNVVGTACERCIAIQASEV